MFAFLEKSILKHGYDQEQFVKRCRRITESISEETLSIEGEFLTEAAMREEKKWSEQLGFRITTVPREFWHHVCMLTLLRTRIAGIKLYCAKRPHLLR